MRRAFLSLGLAVMSATTPAAAGVPPSQAPCLTDPAREALDFALGDWGIFVNDRPVAWITLEKDGNGCVIRERYGVPINGEAGAGLDYWDGADKIWRRILVTSVGTIESFEGFHAGGKFIWNGREQRINGDIVLERVEIWREGETVRNDIYQSSDGGVTWELRGSETRKKRVR